MNISGHTEPYAVLGHPIGHSLSPVMHNAAFGELGLDAVYLAFDVDPARLMSVLPAMADMGFRGVNLTVPLKEVAFRGLEDLDESARRLGAVNTVEVCPDGHLRGHNTDGAGFVLALNEALGTGVAGKSVFIIGSGGAGRAVAITCAAEGAARVAVTDVDTERAARLAEEIAGVAPNVPVQTVDSTPGSWPEVSGAADLVVHATPVGMKEGESSVLGRDGFRQGQMAFDLIYMYPQSAFMRAATAAGAKAANGLGMLLHQGAKAFSIWKGRPAAVGAMRTALEQHIYT